MNDLGWNLGWLAVQVAVVLTPALGLRSLASRRGPASGAWVATWSLGMVVALGLAAFLPGFEGETRRPTPLAPTSRADRPVVTPTIEPARTDEAADRAGRSAVWTPTLDRFRRAWDRFERRAAGPVGRFRPWGQAFALASLAGSGLGLIRLLVGLWAVGTCRRRGRPVSDPALLGLVEELRRAMGCRPAVEVREVPDLATPATAGWLRPMLLLPRDWRGWDDSERRAVVAHELAHVLRGDYAAGLLARVAVVLNFYHPLVRRMARRLHLDQELAADALGARFAGGRSSYLRALSRLALAQEGRPTGWPARAFLTGRGTLIRRIAMLRIEMDSRTVGQDVSRARWLVTALGLLALTIGVANWKAPASAADDKPDPGRPADPRPVSVDGLQARPFEVNYIPEGCLGVAAFRPSELLGRSGMSEAKPLLDKLTDEIVSRIAQVRGVDPSKPGFRTLRAEDVESVVFTFEISNRQHLGRDPKLGGEKLYRLEIFESGGVTMRTIAPIDWPDFLRQWKVELEEVREPRGVFHRIKSDAFAMNVGFYQPDDRTIIYHAEKVLKELIAREVPMPPTYLRGSEWGRVCRDPIAFAIDTKEDGIARRMNLGRPQDAPVLAFFQGVDRLAFGLGGSGDLIPRGELTTRDPDSSDRVARSIDGLAKLGLAALATLPPSEGPGDRAIGMGRGLLSHLKSRRDGRTLAVTSEGCGSFADLGLFLTAYLEMTELEVKAAEARTDGKTEKR